jgi:hypothetical protein
MKRPYVAPDGQRYAWTGSPRSFMAGVKATRGRTGCINSAHLLGLAEDSGAIRQLSSRMNSCRRSRRRDRTWRP